MSNIDSPEQTPTTVVETKPEDTSMDEIRGGIFTVIAVIVIIGITYCMLKYLGIGIKTCLKKMCCIATCGLCYNSSSASTRPRANNAGPTIVIQNNNTNTNTNTNANTNHTAAAAMVPMYAPQPLPNQAAMGHHTNATYRQEPIPQVPTAVPASAPPPPPMNPEAMK